MPSLVSMWTWYVCGVPSPPLSSPSFSKRVKTRKEEGMRAHASSTSSGDRETLPTYLSPPIFLFPFFHGRRDLPCMPYCNKTAPWNRRFCRQNWGGVVLENLFAHTCPFACLFALTHTLPGNGIRTDAVETVVEFARAGNGRSRRETELAALPLPRGTAASPAAAHLAASHPEARHQSSSPLPLPLSRTGRLCGTLCICILLPSYLTCLPTWGMPICSACQVKPQTKLFHYLLHINMFLFLCNLSAFAESPQNSLLLHESAGEELTSIMGDGGRRHIPDLMDYQQPSPSNMHCMRTSEAPGLLLCCRLLPAGRTASIRHEPPCHHHTLT